MAGRQTSGVLQSSQWESKHGNTTADTKPSTSSTANRVCLQKNVGETHKEREDWEETDSEDDDRDGVGDEHLVNEDDIPVQEDEGELPEDYEISDITEEPIDSFYYPVQTHLANEIVERLKLMYHYHFNRTLSDFTDFDFRIYTANLNMLEKQTWTRLSRKESECLPERLYEGSDIEARKIAATKVHKYNKSTVKRTHEELVREVQQNKHKLFLIVADEAHWGVTTKEQANYMLVNTWNHEDHPNVFVLLVTATPYNLLSDNTRLPKVYYRYDSEDQPQFLLEEEATRFKLRGYKFNKLHIIKWTESFTSKVKQGIIVNFKVPLPAQESLVQLCNTQQKGAKDLISWKSVRLSDGECKVNHEYLIRGDENKVTVKTADGNQILVVMNEKVGFIDINQMPIKGATSEFSILVRYGEGILLFKFTGKDRTEKLLCFDKDTDEVRFCRHLTALEESDYESPSPECSFLTENCRPEGSLSTVKEYISLNHYFNSMRYEERHRKLIRTDNEFKNISNALKREKMQDIQDKEANDKAHLKRNSEQSNDDETVSDLLAAEYSYYIILINTLRETLDCLAGENMKNLSDLAREFPSNRRKKIKKFQKALAQNCPDNIHPIDPHVMDRYLSYLSASVLQQYEKIFAEFMKHPNDTEITDELLSVIISCVLHLDEGDFTAKVLVNLQDNKHNANLGTVIKNYKDISLDEKINEIIEESETGYIVDSLILRDPSKADGKMKIIRVNQKFVANRMFRTLCIARQIAFSVTKNYAFEILRDFGTTKLCEDFEGKQASKKERRASYRIRKRLQPKKCNYVNLETYESCDCSFDRNERFLPDIDLRCTRCAHMHKRIEKYTDLEGLPCVLILVYKGRLGDTFPQSFDAIDLRLCYREKDKKKTPLYLSSVVQELGRLCRYKNMSDTSPLPYALVGGYLEKIFQEALLKGSTYFASLSLQSFRVELDRKITEKKNDLNDGQIMRAQVAKQGTPEFGNTDTHKNRILLYAEPQIGKTGVYLRVISILRKLLSPDQLTDDSDDDLEDKDGDLEYKEIESGIVQDVTDIHEGSSSGGAFNRATHWEFPSKDDMKTGEKLPKRIKRGKYIRMYGEYEYGKIPEILPNAVLNFNSTGKPKKPNKPTKPNQNNDFKEHVSVKTETFKAYNSKEHSLCTKCNIHFESKIFELSFKRQLPDATEENEIQYRLSIPLSVQFTDLLKSIRHHTDFSESLISMEESNDTSEDTKLKTWIFIPTYNRPDTGNFHLYHTMVNQKKDPPEKCYYVSVLVVRSTEFKGYCKLWRSTHAILQIPDTIPGEERNVHSGGAGYPRLAIQLFAESLELKWIFMLDDNIRTTKDIKIQRTLGQNTCNLPFDKGCSTTQILNNYSHEGTVNVHENGSLDEGVVPLFSVLKHLEKQIDGSVQDLESYTGSSDHYGILGVKVNSKYSGFVKTPFKKTHVYSLILLNIGRLQAEKIYYKPWQAFEDITLNIDCDNRNLWVCKYNRFTVCKNFNVSWFPKVFCWDDEVVLENFDKPKAENSVDLLFKWVCSAFPIKNIVEIPENTGARKRGTQSDIMLKRLSDLKGKYQMIAIQYQDSRDYTQYTGKSDSTGRASSFDRADLCQIKHRLREYFAEVTQSPNESNYTLVMLTSDFCIKHALKSKASLKLWLQEIMHEDFQLTVVTSHNVNFFKLEIVLLIVKVAGLSKPGTSKTPNNQRKKSAEKQKHKEVVDHSTTTNKSSQTDPSWYQDPNDVDLAREAAAVREKVRVEIYEMARDLDQQTLMSLWEHVKKLSLGGKCSSDDQPKMDES